MSWGYHLLLNCWNCDREAISRPAKVLAWLHDLLARIDMKAVGEPWIAATGLHDENLSGLTLMQCIQTSGVMAHFIDATRQAYIDVFSCKPFNDADVYDCVRQWFGPESIKTLMLERQA